MSETSTRSLACEDCGAAMVKNPRGGPPKKYCPACTLTRRRASARDYQRRRKAGIALEPERYPCQACRQEVVWAHRGYRSDWCASCSDARSDEYHRAYRKSIGHDEIGTEITIQCDCGNEFQWVVLQGRRASKCSDCRNAAYERHKRISSERRRASAPAADLSLDPPTRLVWA